MGSLNIPTYLESPPKKQIPLHPRHSHASALLFNASMAHPRDNIFAGTESFAHAEAWRKHAMHLLRLLLTGATTLRECDVPVHLPPSANRERLLAVKRGELLWAEVDAWRKELHRDFEQALAETKLPERLNHEAANGILIRCRSTGSLPKHI